LFLRDNILELQLQLMVLDQLWHLVRKAACTSMWSTYKVLNHFICSGFAYGTISNLLPPPLLIPILTVGWKLGSLLGYKPYYYAVVEAPYPSKAACTSMWSTYKVCLNHFIWSGWAYGTIGNPLPPPLLIKILTVGWKLGSLLGYTPYYYAVVEAPYPSKAACTSMWSTHKVFEPLHLHMQWTGIWNHWQPVTIALVVPDFDSQLKGRVLCGATNHTIMQWLRLHTHPKLLAHQYGAHIRCLNHFICSGWAYGTIGNPLPPPMLTQILKVGWHPPGSHCWAPNHTIMQCLRLERVINAFASRVACY